MITSIEPQNFLFAQLHQLLGTGNDVKNTIQLIADEGFEQWSQVLIELYEEFIETEARERHLKELKAALHERIDTFSISH